MPVEFLTDDEAAAYGRYWKVPSRAELAKLFSSMTRTAPWSAADAGTT